MAKRKTDVRICPFCGHHGHKLNHSTVKMRYEDGETEVRDIWQMECICCGAMGPTEYRPMFAVESWNYLHEKPAHGDDPLEEAFEYEDPFEYECPYDYPDDDMSDNSIS